MAAKEWINRKISVSSEKGREIPRYPLRGTQTFGLRHICWKLLLLPPVLSFGTNLLKNMARQCCWFSYLDEHAPLPVGKRRGFLLSECTMFEQPPRNLPQALALPIWHTSDWLSLPAGVLPLMCCHLPVSSFRWRCREGGKIYADTMYAIMKTEDKTPRYHTNWCIFAGRLFAWSSNSCHAPASLIWAPLPLQHPSTSFKRAFFPSLVQLAPDATAKQAVAWDAKGRQHDWFS